MRTLLEVQGLNVAINNFSLRNIEFSLPEGCITGFIGINGAGKTTTIKSILGLIMKESGTINLLGKDIANSESEFKNNIGIVMDDGYFYDEMTLKEMTSIIAPAYSNWSYPLYNSYIERFNLNHKQKISTLSKGMRMKYAIAIALAHEAKLLIMDEPTSGLDPLMRNELVNILQEYMSDGNRSVFFSTHITSDLDKVADIIILIHNGRIILNEEKDTLLESHVIVKGDKNLLSDDVRKLFITLNESKYGFKGITSKKQAVKSTLKHALLEKPSIEDIMLAYTGGAKNDI